MKIVIQFLSTLWVNQKPSKHKHWLWLIKTLMWGDKNSPTFTSIVLHELKILSREANLPFSFCLPFQCGWIPKANSFLEEQTHFREGFVVQGHKRKSWKLFPFVKMAENMEVYPETLSQYFSLYCAIYHQTDRKKEQKGNTCTINYVEPIFRFSDLLACKELTHFQVWPWPSTYPNKYFK